MLENEQSQDQTEDVIQLTPSEIAKKLKRANKNHLKSILNKKISFGQNHIMVKKVSEKYITIVELQNGLTQEHRRYILPYAGEYVEYKKSILARSNSEIGFDPEKQSPEYRQQYKNVTEAIDEINWLLGHLYEQTGLDKIMNFKSQIDTDSITIHFENGEHIQIIFRFENDIPKLGISTNLNFSNMVSWEQLKMLKYFNDICNLCLGVDEKISLEMMKYCKLLYMGYNQLEKLQSLSNVEDADETVRADISNFIETGKPKNTYSLIIEDHEFNGKIYQRQLRLTKLSRIRTTVEIVGISEDKTFVEFKLQIPKISHNITDNTNKILQIYTALK